MHEIKFRAYFEDTDAGGVVYHGNYFNFCERARTELLNACGYTNMGLIASENILFVVRHVTGDYLKPILLEESFTVQTHVKAMRNTSMVLNQCLIKDDGSKAFEADITLVCVNKDELKPVRIPEKVRDGFLNYQ